MSSFIVTEILRVQKQAVGILRLNSCFIVTEILRVQKPQIQKSVFISQVHYDWDNRNCQSSKVYSDNKRIGDSTLISIISNENN